jgi:hypothetical protein
MVEKAIGSDEFLGPRDKKQLVADLNRSTLTHQDLLGTLQSAISRRYNDENVGKAFVKALKELASSRDLKEAKFYLAPKDTASGNLGTQGAYVIGLRIETRGMARVLGSGERKNPRELAMGGSSTGNWALEMVRSVIPESKAPEQMVATSILYKEPWYSFRGKWIDDNLTSKQNETTKWK